MKSRLLRAAALAAVLLASSIAAASANQAVTLRNGIETAGTAVTLGDVFENAGAAGSRAIAPAPTAGRTATFSPRFLQAAARAAGLDWTPPEGMTAVLVSGRGGANISSARYTPASNTASAYKPSSGDLAVRRGETVTLIYTTPGLRVTTRARAMTDGAVGDPVRLINLSSNRTIDAVVTGAGAATASN